MCAKAKKREECKHKTIQRPTTKMGGLGGLGTYLIKVCFEHRLCIEETRLRSNAKNVRPSVLKHNGNSCWRLIPFGFIAKIYLFTAHYQHRIQYSKSRSRFTFTLQSWMERYDN